jgi:hypothetical protein
MSDNWRAAFPRGCRVEVDREALVAYRKSVDRSWPTQLQAPYTGTVIGYSHYSERELYLLLDGRACGRRYPVRFVRRLDDTP